MSDGTQFYLNLNFRALLYRLHHTHNYPEYLIANPYVVSPKTLWIITPTYLVCQSFGYNQHQIRLYHDCRDFTIFKLYDGVSPFTTSYLMVIMLCSCLQFNVRKSYGWGFWRILEVALEMAFKWIVNIYMLNIEYGAWIKQVSHVNIIWTTVLFIFINEMRSHLICNVFLIALKWLLKHSLLRILNNSYGKIIKTRT